MNKAKLCCLLTGLMIFTSSARADAFKDFLLACGYGTIAGALVGVASVAFSENPSEKSMNIARGASLGLYAGIGYGIYQAQNPQGQNTGNSYTRESTFWVEPLYHEKSVDGLKTHWDIVSF